MYIFLFAEHGGDEGAREPPPADQAGAERRVRVPHAGQAVALPAVRRAQPALPRLARAPHAETRRGAALKCSHINIVALETRRGAALNCLRHKHRGFCFETRCHIQNRFQIKPNAYCFEKRRPILNCFRTIPYACFEMRRLILNCFKT